MLPETYKYFYQTDIGTIQDWRNGILWKHKKCRGTYRNLERILTLVFVLIDHYESIGFIITAKSLLRFKDTDTAKTEYVLAGTLLSFGIATLCGLIAKQFFVYSN